MPYLRGVSSIGCPDYSLKEFLALAVRHRLDAVELRALGGTVDLPQHFASAFGSPAVFAARLREAAVKVVTFNTGLHLIDPAPGEREKFLEFLPWAEKAGIRWLRVFDGGKTADAGEMERAAEAADWWQSIRAANGWQADLMIETHDSLFTIDAIRRFMQVVPNLNILWDSHHTWKRGGEEPVDTWQAIKSRVVHIHVKDSISRPGANHPYTYVPPGTGEFPMASLRTRLQKEFAGVVSLEWESLWHADLTSLEEAIQTAARQAWW
ncbi:MAG TPA: TIM barrel protein [Candidatus Didemnitutus sp.]|nr:TIM barrel protein [Candidatus Didemnitutus sp.]